MVIANQGVVSMKIKTNLIVIALSATSVMSSLVLADESNANTVSVPADLTLATDSVSSITPTVNLVEALTGFDNITNGYISQDDFNAGKARFEKRKTIGDGLGPFYNAESCADCHQGPVTGAGSQVAVIRAGRFNDGEFTPPPGGGSLITERTIDANLQVHVDDTLNVRTFRVSTNALGDGYVEAIADQTLLDIAARQAATRGAIKGQAILVPILEAPGATRVGRFGAKDQHASLLSFSGDAARNELGISNPLVATESTPNGVDGSQFDTVADPEDADSSFINGIASFMRATKAPEPDHDLANTPDAIAGEQVFDKVGCDSCHVQSITTAPTGTVLSPAFTVPEALGNKTIHPFSDFLLHDVGTNDGIVQNGGAATRNKVRTTPLWGLRTHTRLLHDGSALTLDQAIKAHSGEASQTVKKYKVLSDKDTSNLLSFLKSL